MILMGGVLLAEQKSRSILVEALMRTSIVVKPWREGGSRMKNSYVSIFCEQDER
jgi:hypothetical protein